MSKEKVQGTLLPLGIDRKKHFVGMDQSYTGFAFTVIAPDDDEYASFVLSTKPTDNPVERLIEIRTWLKAKLDIWADCPMALEGYGYSSSVAFMLGELGATIKLTVHDTFNGKRRPIIVTPTQLKKYATGKGQAKKAEIMLNVYKKWGVEFTDDDMADSYVLAKIASGHAETKAEKEVLNAVRFFY